MYIEHFKEKSFNIENETCDWAVRILQPSTCTSNLPVNGFDSFVLANNRRGGSAQYWKRQLDLSDNTYLGFIDSKKTQRQHLPKVLASHSFILLLSGLSELLFKLSSFLSDLNKLTFHSKLAKTERKIHFLIRTEENIKHLVFPVVWFLSKSCISKNV